MLHSKLPKITLAVALAISASSLIAQVSLSSYRLNADGYGPVKIGMTPEQASIELGIRLSPAGELDEDDIHCHYVYPDGDYQDIGFMVIEGKIVRIDVYSRLISANGNILVGSDESIIKKSYPGKVTEKIHPYIGTDGKYLTVSINPGFAYVFETDKGKVSRFRVGLEKPVQYIEGCL